MNNIKLFEDFTKFAKEKGVKESMLSKEAQKLQNGFINPYVLEERSLNVSPLDLYSRLMYDRTFSRPHREVPK